MTDQAINEAIAKACGWTCDGKWWSHPTLPDNGGAMPDPPDYCTDLNAMHEAEKTLSVEQKHNTYQEHLHAVVVSGKEGLTIGDAWYLQIHATARQRAEAFLRTLNLWSDDTTERKETK